METTITEGLGLRYSLIGPFETMQLNANGMLLVPSSNPFRISFSFFPKINGRVLSRIYRLEEKSRMAEGDELPRGAGGIPSRKFFQVNMP